MTNNQRSATDKRVRVLTSEEKKNIEELYLEKKMGIAIASKALKISIPVIAKYLTSVGKLRSQEEMVAIRSKNNQVDFTSDQVKEMVDMFNKGVSVYKIKKHFDTSTVPVVRALIKGGVPKKVFTKWTMGPIRDLLKTLED